MCVSSSVTSGLNAGKILSFHYKRDVAKRLFVFLHPTKLCKSNARQRSLLSRSFRTSGPRGEAGAADVVLRPPQSIRDTLLGQSSRPRKKKKESDDDSVT